MGTITYHSIDGLKTITSNTLEEENTELRVRIAELEKEKSDLEFKNKELKDHLFEIEFDD